MLGPRVRRPRVFDFQQPTASPARKIRQRRQVILPPLRGRVHEDDGSQRSHGARQVQDAQVFGLLSDTPVAVAERRSRKAAALGTLWPRTWRMDDGPVA